MAKFEWRPRDKWGRINCVTWGRYSLTWDWTPTKKFAWAWRPSLCPETRFFRFSPLTLCVVDRDG